MFTIGEFSRITGLSIKALRLYQEKGIIQPHAVDERTGYRYYDHRDAEKARSVRLLKRLELPLDEIAHILRECRQDADALEILEHHRAVLEGRSKELQKAKRLLNSIISTEREAITMTKYKTNQIEEKIVPDIRIAGIRWKGRYGDTGKHFGRLCRQMGRYIAGKPFNLYYDEGFKEEDADIESCVPVRQGGDVPARDGISLRVIPGGKIVSLVHQGPYDQLGRSYEKICAYLKQKNYTVAGPPREIYLKGPGMIFRGDPKKYLTEIQFPISR